jgi:hypothetical protein
MIEFIAFVFKFFVAVHDLVQLIKTKWTWW